MESDAQTIIDPVPKVLGYFQVEEETFPSSYWAILLLGKPFVDLTRKGSD
jgi:hypothetical protein